MKRLFFLFVFLFIGFGAFGQVNSLRRAKFDSLKIHFEERFEELKREYTYIEKAFSYPKHFDTSSVKIEKNWYVNFSYWGIYGSWDYMVLQDNLYAPFTFSGHGFSFPFSMLGRINRKKIHAEFDTDLLQFIFLRPNRDQREAVEDLLGRDMWISIKLASSVAYRLKESPHYAGLSFRFSYDEYWIVGHNRFRAIPVSFRLFYLYHGKIRNIPFTVSTTLPISTIFNHEAEDVKNIFRPNLKIELFSDIPFGKKRDSGISISYRLDYLNYTYKYSNYNHRHLTHSIGVIFGAIE